MQCDAQRLMLSTAKDQLWLPFSSSHLNSRL